MAAKAPAKKQTVGVRWSTVGNAPARAGLERAIIVSPAHAYLFVGPEGVGKAKAALDFAAALNCESQPKPCGQCRPCRDTFADRHPDVEVVAPGGLCDESEHRDHSESRDIRICQVRRLQRVLSLTPYESARRIAIVDGADRLNIDAANAFLKTLEQPPDSTVLILVSEREDRLPETVRSRCQRIAFTRIDRETIAAALVERGVESEQAASIAAAAGGRMGWALRAAEDPGLMANRRDIIDGLVRLAHGGRMQRFAWANPGPERGSTGLRDRYLSELDLWETWWRDVLAVASGSREGIVNAERMPELEDEGKLYVAADVVTFLRAAQKTREHLRSNVDVQLALENLVLDMPRPRLTAVQV